jgi:uncharacterized MAPEG superfamily protein
MFATLSANTNVYYDVDALTAKEKLDDIMTTELDYLAAVTILTLFMRVPWMLNKVSVRGLKVVVGYPEEPVPLSGWAHRLWVAHEDALQSLLIFAILVVVVHLSNAADATTRIVAAVYFWARALHVCAYLLVLPWVKTVAYLVGFGAQLWFAWVLVS